MVILAQDWIDRDPDSPFHVYKTHGGLVERILSRCIIYADAGSADFNAYFYTSLYNAALGYRHDISLAQQRGSGADERVWEDVLGRWDEEASRLQVGGKPLEL